MKYFPIICVSYLKIVKKKHMYFVSERNEFENKDFDMNDFKTITEMLVLTILYY